MRGQPLTIASIAQLAGVSQATVSRVLNDHPHVRAIVRSRVQQVIEEHGYVPQAAAQALASQRSNVIAFLIPRSTAFLFSDPFFALVIQGVAEACAKAGYFLTLSLVGGGVDTVPLDRLLRGGHFDGVIVQAGAVDDPVLPLLIKAHIPLVQIGRHPNFEHLAWVDAENREGARFAVAHLAAMGRRRIATVTGPQQETAALDRCDGYKQALLEAGLPIDPELIVDGDWGHESGAAAVIQLMSLPHRPDAIFAASDRMAIGALHTAHALGVHVPDDLAVAGFDDIPDAAFTTPPLTTVRSPIHVLGAAATRMLIALIADESASPRHQVFPTTLIVRGTSGQNDPPALAPSPPLAEQIGSAEAAVAPRH